MPQGGSRYGCQALAIRAHRAPRQSRRECAVLCIQHVLRRVRDADASQAATARAHGRRGRVGRRDRDDLRDRRAVGSRRPTVVTAAGLISAAVWAFALFPLAASSVPMLMLAAAVGGLCHGTIVGGMSAFFVELFPTSARYTGFSTRLPTRDGFFWCHRATDRCCAAERVRIGGAGVALCGGDDGAGAGVHRAVEGDEGRGSRARRVTACAREAQPIARPTSAGDQSALRAITGSTRAARTAGRRAAARAATIRSAGAATKAAVSCGETS